MFFDVTELEIMNLLDEKNNLINELDCEQPSQIRIHEINIRLNEIDETLKLIY